ncbi:phage Gp37/Gp68 family protein [Limnohabitans radicicola]|uniref:Phage Gp37/Gp68 family protein n=1 Tax=Limnohabitans radicicola TaxID=2771427 RepID=A0A927FGP6_9BURK|nr:phage Gp37/Gp68 family protein [Limnohabitans radicicola]MBD8051129.1 phage Gp37/Gp68 family protein [Limnohabitans radicicola]
MSKDTKIEWADHTFNPWVGCTKVSPACDHCYAEGWAKRSGMVQWGAHAQRRRTSDANWRQPTRWNADAKRLGIRYRVFCSSLADVFDSAVPAQWRIELMKLICETPHLDWLLLTKRIGNASAMLETSFRAVYHQREGWADNIPSNVWIGATICNQEEADRDIPKLLAVPAARRFLSMEPLLGPVDLSQVQAGSRVLDVLQGGGFHETHFEPLPLDHHPRVDWVIVGGESGHGARPMHPQWVRSLRDQCQAAAVPFFFKQHGEWQFCDEGTAVLTTSRRMVHVQLDGSFHDSYQGVDANQRVEQTVWVGKKAAGRMLDGRDFSEVPV